MTAKQQFFEMMQGEPDNISVQEMKQCLDMINGLRQVENGETVPHEEVVEMIEEILNDAN